MVLSQSLHVLQLMVKFPWRLLTALSLSLSNPSFHSIDVHHYLAIEYGRLL